VAVCSFYERFVEMVLVFSDKVLGIMRHDLIDHISVEVLINYPLVFRSLFLMKSGTKICLSSLRLLSTFVKAWDYTGCHRYVPFGRFPNRRTCRVQRIKIITNMTTAIIGTLFRQTLYIATTAGHRAGDCYPISQQIMERFTLGWG